MRLLIDENVHRAVVARLRANGFEVEWIRESALGMIDRDILSRPDIATWVFVTNDRDFGELIFNKGLSAPHAILYTRLPHRLPEAAADALIAVLRAGVPAGRIITLRKSGNRARQFRLGANNG